MSKLRIRLPTAFVRPPFATLTKVILTSAVVLVVGSVLVGSQGRPLRAAGEPIRVQDDGPETIRRLIAADEWVHNLKGLRLVAECIERKTTDGADEFRRKLQARYPEKPADYFTLEEFPAMAQVRRGRKELCFDRRRFAFSWSMPEGQTAKASAFENRLVWNGTALIEHITGGRGDWFGKGLTPDIQRELITGHYPWLRLWSHPLWFAAGLPRDQFYGEPDEYHCAGETKYRDALCRVYEWMQEPWNLSSMFRRVYVRDSDGRVVAWQEGKYVHSQGSKLEAAQLAAFRSLGEELIDLDDAWIWWLHGLPTERREELMPKLREAIQLAWAQLRPFPIRHYWVDDYREVAPGCWFPMRQAWQDVKYQGDGKPVELSSMELVFSVVDLNPILRDEEFVIQIPDGIQITELRADQEAMTNEVDKLRAQQNALKVGDAAPAFPAGTWLNTEPLSLAELRGQVVILNFWSVSNSGPRLSRGLTAFRRLERGLAAEGIRVVGIHTGADDEPQVRETVAKLKVQYPQLIDPTILGANRLFVLGQKYLPLVHSECVVIDQDGKISALGPFPAAVQKARQLTAQSSRSD